MKVQETKLKCSSYKSNNKLYDKILFDMSNKKKKEFRDNNKRIFVVDEEFMKTAIFLNRMLLNAYEKMNDFAGWWDSRCSNEQYQKLDEIGGILNELE